MLEVVLALGAFVGALLMGAAAMAALSPDRRWRGYAEPDKAILTGPREYPPAFEPLTMDQFPLGWPSEAERPSTAIDELPWPSETWDDDYFGQAGRDDVSRIAVTAALIDEQRALRTQEAQRTRKREDAEAAVRAADADHEREQEAERQVDRARKRQQEKKRKVEAARSPRKKTPRPAQERAAEADFFGEPPPPPSTPADALTPDDIASLVQQYGLAGAVEHIRAKTGWDFRTAAQHLAEVLRNR